MTEQGNGRLVRGKGARGRWIRVTRIHIRCLCGGVITGLVANRNPLRMRCPRACVADTKTHLDVTVSANQRHDEIEVETELFHGFVQLGGET